MNLGRSEYTHLKQIQIKYEGLKTRAEWIVEIREFATFYFETHTEPFPGMFEVITEALSDLHRYTKELP